jgi:hypothetical protein
MSGFNRDRGTPQGGRYNPPRGGGGFDPRPSGLAANLPSSSLARVDRDRERRSEPVARAENTSNNWRSDGPAESYGDREPRGWGGRPRNDVGDADDKFAKSFSKMGGPSTSSAAPFERNFNDERPRDFDRPREGGNRFRERQAEADVNAVDDKFSRAFGGGGSNRREGGDSFGGSRREGREGGDSFGGSRREGGDSFGGSRREGGDSFGGNRREGGAGGGMSSGDARNRRREDDGEWKNDPRFASKFGSGGGGSGRNDRGRDRDGGRGGGRRNQEYDPTRFDGPIPTAPRAARNSEQDQSRVEEEEKKIETARLAKEAEAQRVKEEKEAAKAARMQAEQEAKKAKEEAKKAEEEAKQSKLNALQSAFTITTETIASGLKGNALTDALKTKLTAPILPAGVLKAMLVSLNDDYFSTKWYADEHFGNALKELFEGSIAAQISLLYAVQAFCAEKKFPKIKTSSGEKRLIEVLFTTLIKAELVEVDGVVAWADDGNLLNIPGRTEAIVQTTSMVTLLRTALEEDEEEGDYDDDDFKQNYVK